MTMDNRQRLIIRVGRASLAFSTTTDGGIVYERYPLKSSISMAANLREALRTVTMLQESYGRVIVLVDSPVLMVPSETFREDDCDALYRYTFSGQEQCLVVYHVVPELNAVAVFGLHKDLRLVLVDRFGESLRLQPVVASIWRHLYQRSFTGPRQKLYGYGHDGWLEVMSFAQNRFRFCNAFNVGSEQDNALFYLLSVWKQLGLDARTDELHLAGDLPGREQLAEKARQFVKRVFVNNPSGEFNRSAVTLVDGMPYDLMTLYVKGR